MGHGLLGTNLGHGFFGFDPTPGYSATNALKSITGTGSSNTVRASNPLGITNQSNPNSGVQQAAGSAPAQATPADPGSGAYTGGAGSGIDPNTGLSYDQLEQQANSQLGNLDQQFNVGNQNILDAYNSSFNQLLGQKGIADRNYNTSKAQTLQDYTAARGNNQAQTGQQANSLQRLLGAHGYQGSANTAAGYAAARQGAVGNQQLEQGFGRNQQALDTNYGDFNNQYNTSVGDLGHQRDVQKNKLQAQVDQSKQGLLQQLSAIANARGGNGASYQPQIDQLGQQITQLGQEYASPVLQATPAVYQAPSLESYNVQQQGAPSLNNTPGAAGNVSPFLSVLLGQDKKNTNLASLGL